jgi:hypothetical protein
MTEALDTVGAFGSKVYSFHLDNQKIKIHVSLLFTIQVQLRFDMDRHTEADVGRAEAPNFGRVGHAAQNAVCFVFFLLLFAKLTNNRIHTIEDVAALVFMKRLIRRAGQQPIARFCQVQQ